MSQPEKLHFKTSSGIKNIVGKDLITDRFVAIFELVKNAYDANASNVIVSFDFSLDDESQTLIIRDNGTGMSRDDLENKWLYLAYSEKQEGKSNDDRKFVGSKGIGRFSCDSLGEYLKIHTKKSGESVEHQLIVNWPDFEKDHKNRFENIGVEYTQNVAESNKVSKSYTILEIRNLRHEWNKKSIDRVAESLRRLKNPFITDDGFNIYCGENILSRYRNYDEIPDQFLIKSNISEVLKDKSITIETSINENIKIDLFDRGVHIYTLEKNNDSLLKNVAVFISLNYLTPSAKSTFTRRMGIEPVNYGNIFIYRNNFRVSPYGDVDYDLFGLNTRKTQGYSRYIATRELIGHIDIADDSDHFKETSSRNNGFIQNIYMEELENVYMSYAHKHLERYVNLINWGEFKDKDTDTNEVVFFNDVDASETEKFIKSLTSKVNGGFDLTYFDEDISFDEHNPKKQLEKLAEQLPEKEQTKVNEVIKKFDTLEKENQEKEVALSNKEQIITSLELQNQNILSRRPESSYGEQLSHHLPAMADKLDESVRQLHELNLSLTDSQKDKFYEALRKIRRTELELRGFKNLLLNTSIDLRSPQTISWVEMVRNFASDKNTPGNRHLPKVTCNTDDKQAETFWQIKSNAIEFVMMLENFYRNAYEHKATYLEVSFSDDFMEVKSNSTPIDEVNLSKIFELGFSTKGNGTGIGLNQVFNFLTKCKLNIEAQNLKNEVCFRITKKGVS
ncbi:MAG: ATP-binding protein [Methylotenera sp.]|nr:ATP-binding protein [Methylotenera sp.]